MMKSRPSGRRTLAAREVPGQRLVLPGLAPFFCLARSSLMGHGALRQRQQASSERVKRPALEGVKVARANRELIGDDDPLGKMTAGRFARPAVY